LGYVIKKSILAVATTVRMKHLILTAEEVNSIHTHFELYDDESVSFPQERSRYTMDVVMSIKQRSSKDVAKFKYL
jgi:hypothetical protein